MNSVVAIACFIGWLLGSFVTWLCMKGKKNNES